jgi:hypothetical protein
MPMGRSPSTTTTEPTPWSTIRALASATVSDEVAVMAGELITSDTVVTARGDGMGRILPPKSAGFPGQTAHLLTQMERWSANVHRPAARSSRDRALAVTGGRDSPPVLRLTTLLRRLGPSGAVANVRAVLEERQREDLLVERLACRLAPALPAPASAPSPAAAVARQAA